MESPLLLQTIASIGEAIQHERVSVAEIADEALKQIERLNSRLNAVITTHPNVREQAEKYLFD
ncbi:hypothetical protein GCM10028778_22530 [Barrientosiimonas marina]|uniref:Amidase n=1 Tax=Lentibacillus kimchii TaxID=1542911 RepID=A0ABW2UUL3_9BACI